MERKLITAAAVRDLLGGVTEMTIWRWLHNPDLAFPRPVQIARRNYWKEAEIHAWIEVQAEARKAAA